MWSTATGDPVGVIMNFLEHEGRFWLTCTRRRKRVAAVEARPARRHRGDQPRDRHRAQSLAHLQGQRHRARQRRGEGVVLPGPRRVRPPGQPGPAGSLRRPPEHPGPGGDRDRADRADRVRLGEHVQELPRRPHQVTAVRTHPSGRAGRRSTW